MATKTGNLKSLLKATPMGELRTIAAEEDSTINTSRGGDYINLKDGKNKFRIWPTHPDFKKFLVVVNKIWLLTEKDDGTTGRTTALNARIHGGFKKDLVEEYVRLATKKLSRNEKKTDAEKLKNLTNNMKGGLVYGNTWVGYMDAWIGTDAEQFGLVELKRAVRDAIYNQAFIEGEGEELQHDPFTDPDDGRPFTVMYNSKAKKAADYYKTVVSTKPLPIDEAKVEAFLAMTPLEEMFKYTAKDFQKQCEGLRLYDLENEIDLYEDEDFQELIEKMTADLTGIDDTDESEEKKPATKAKAKSRPAPVAEDEDETAEDTEEDADESEESTEDIFESMTRQEMIKFKNEKGYEIKLLKTDSDDDMREKLREVYVPYTEDQAEESEETDEEQEEEAPAPKKPVAKPAAKAADSDKLSALKDRLKNNAKKNG